MAQNQNIVDFQAMRSAASTIGENATLLTNIDSKVANTVGGLTRSWTGDAAKAYTNVMAEWQAKFQGIIKKLSAIETVLNQNNSALQNNEQNNTPMARNIQAQLQS